MKSVLRYLGMFLAVFSTSTLLMLPATTFAATDVLNTSCQQVPDASLCQDNSQSETNENNSVFGPSGVLTKVANLISLIVGIASVIMIIIGGLRYVLASGDANNLNAAKNTILYAVVGLIVAVFARIIVVYVLNKIFS